MHTYQPTLFDQQVIRPDRATLKTAILSIIDHEPPMKARQIAYRLSKKFGVTIYRHDVNSVIYSELRRILCVQAPTYLVVRRVQDVKYNHDSRITTEDKSLKATNTADLNTQHQANGDAFLRWLMPIGFIILGLEALRMLVH